MACITEKGNGKYRIDVFDGFRSDGKPNRLTKTITAKSRKDAERQAQAIEVDFKRGQIEQPKKEVTFGDIVIEWRRLIAPDYALKSRDFWESQLRDYILPVFERMPIDSIKVIDIDNYLNSLSIEGARKPTKSGKKNMQGFSQQTIKHHYTIINRMFNLANAWEMTVRNPCRGAKTPKVDEKEAEYFESDEIARFLERVDAGHTPETMLRKYSHIFAKSKKESANLFSGLYQPSKEDSK